ncbi:APC family permease [Pseudomonas sp. SWRI100]|uniref:APC family permease n=1 Tax=Pseudomonas TaxID=286 RepID=UPI00164848DF|nr:MULTISPECIES: APC family permease [Pseudomonas]MBC3495703.1 APC family permease [Pseudomonas sp. SWRI67]MBV4526811.1 APC family permease [Pseudomonas kermanshahensis]
MGSYKRRIGPISLLYTAIGSIIGSGWLFGSYQAAQLSGPAAILAWVIGAVVMIAIALTYTEMGVMFPDSGGMVRYPQYSHGSLLGFIGAWAIWLALVAVVPIEAVASVQYLASWPYPWAQSLATDGALNTYGLLCCCLLIMVYFGLNYWGVKLFLRASNAITIFKLVVPLFTAVALLSSGYHTENFGLSSMEAFAPNGWNAVLTTVAVSGIVFSYNGFQAPISMAGEAKNPKFSIPFALIGSLLITMVIYVMLQVAFIGALDPGLVAKGWGNLNFSSPMAQLALAVNLNWLAILLYIDAFVSPSGSAVIYKAAVARMLHAMERNGSMPKIFGVLDPVYQVPRIAMWINLFLCFIFLFWFKGWGALAGVVSVAVAVGYLIGPVSVMSLRRTAPDVERSIRISGLSIIAPFAFVCAALILYWARWPLSGQIIFLIIAGLPIYFYFQKKNNPESISRDVRAAAWLIVYLPVAAVTSYIGSPSFGGIGVLSEGWDMLVVAVVALLFFKWGVNSGYRTPYLVERIACGYEDDRKASGESEPLSGVSHV